MQQVNENLNIITNEILTQITALEDKSDNGSKVLMSKLLLDFINQISSCMELNNNIGEFIMKLLNMASKHKSLFTKLETRYLQLTVEYLKIKSVKLSAGYICIDIFIHYFTLI